MITVEEALARLFALVAPLDTETLGLRDITGRVLAEDAIATRDQPPFPASAMDGYAVRNAEVTPGATFQVIGEAPAGQRFPGSVGPGQAVRIFTGGVVPEGTDRIVIQEDTTRHDDCITLRDALDSAAYVRPAGGDFTAGQVVITKGTQLGPAEIALLAAMNLPCVHVHRRPEIAIICTGDELVMPGETPTEDQIIASNGFGLAALGQSAGADCRVLPIAADNAASLRQAFELAGEADLIVTCGGASVGDHDLVADVAQAAGTTLDFHKIAMRPGKPVMAGRIGTTPLIGLPGNPVSSMVCGTVFLLPMLRILQGLPAAPAPRQRARLAAPLGRNGKREHYMRASVTDGDITAFARQDSSLLSVLTSANALLIRPVDDPARNIGEHVDYIHL